MTKRLNPNNVRIALTYDTEELARALGVTPATIRNMVKRELPVLATQKPHLYSGQAVREFIIAENKNSKQPMSKDQLLCMSCQTGRTPLHMSVCLNQLTPKTAVIKGVCNVCGGTCARIVSLSRLPEFSQIFDIKTNAGSTA